MLNAQSNSATSTNSTHSAIHLLAQCTNIYEYFRASDEQQHVHCNSPTHHLQRLDHYTYVHKNILFSLSPYTFHLLPRANDVEKLRLCYYYVCRVIYHMSAMIQDQWEKMADGKQLTVQRCNIRKEVRRAEDC